MPIETTARKSKAAPTGPRSGAERRGGRLEDEPQAQVEGAADEELRGGEGDGDGVELETEFANYDKVRRPEEGPGRLRRVPWLKVQSLAAGLKHPDADGGDEHGHMVERGRAGASILPLSWP